MKRLVLALGFSILSTSTFATPITFTGAELANLPGASFPTGGQSFIGNDLLLEPTSGNSVVYRLDLAQLNADPDFEVDFNTIGISVDLTKLARDDGFLDQDLYIGLFDGQNFFHAFFTDVGNSTFAGNQVQALSSDELTLAGLIFSRDSPSVSAPFGTIAQLDVTIQASPTNTIITSQINQAGPFSSSTSLPLNTSNGLSLLLAANQVGENYLINSLTFTTGVIGPAVTVPEPGTLGGLTFGLAVLSIGLYRRRFV